MMKSSLGSGALFFLLAGIAMAFLVLGSDGATSYEGLLATNHGHAAEPNRKLKEGGSHEIGLNIDKRGLGNVNMEDYPRFDPAPSSKAAIKTGPIEHGTPLMPYMPRPTPPSHPKHGSP